MFLGQVKQKVGNMKWWKPWIHQLLLYVGTARQGRVAKQNSSLKARGIKQIEGPSPVLALPSPASPQLRRRSRGARSRGATLEQGSDAGAESGGSNWSDTDGYEAEDWSAAVAAVPEEQEFAENGNEELEDNSALVSAESAELVTKSTKLMDT